MTGRHRKICVTFFQPSYICRCCFQWIRYNYWFWNGKSYRCGWPSCQPALRISNYLTFRESIFTNDLSVCIVSRNVGCGSVISFALPINGGVYQGTICYIKRNIKSQRRTDGYMDLWNTHNWRKAIIRTSVDIMVVRLEITCNEIKKYSKFHTRKMIWNYDLKMVAFCVHLNALGKLQSECSTSEAIQERYRMNISEANIDAIRDYLECQIMSSSGQFRYPFRIEV